MEAAVEEQHHAAIGAASDQPSKALPQLQDRRRKRQEPETGKRDDDDSDKPHIDEHV